MSSSKNKTITVFTVGFALFAMFFGAGNLILPPFIGLSSGSQWFAALLGFFSTAIFAPFLGVLMVAVSGTSFVDLGYRIHPKLVTILTLLIILCIGPLVAIPRTGATTFEVGFSPSFPELNNVVFSILFFAVVLFLSLSQQKIVDIIGNYLTPFLLASLAALVILGIIHPSAAAQPSTMSFSKSFVFGFMEGYQTLDVLASVVFAGIVISAVVGKGYASAKERSKVTVISGLISMTLLLFIYGGLIYLGATTDYALTENTSRTDLLLHISQSILGKNGTYVISVAISVACLTTAIALTSATGSFFEKLTNGKVSYTIGVIVCTLISMYLSIKSVDDIIGYAVNILLFIYPITFALILYVLLFGRLVKTRLPYIATIIVTAMISLISVFENIKIDVFGLYELKKIIPLNSHNLEWFIPSLVTFIVFAFISRTKKRAN